MRPTELEELLPALIYHLDAPLQNPGGFSYFTASRLAARHVKVSLTGHGGDEVFAGYPAQFHATFGSNDMFDLSGYQRGPIGSTVAASRTHATRGRVRTRASPGQPLFEPSQGPPSFEELWVAAALRLASVREPAGRRRASRAPSATTRRATRTSSPLREAPTDERLDQCLYHDMRFYLPGLLHLEDRVSMSVSLESRVPLLDYRVVELLATVPPEAKVPGRVLQAPAARRCGEVPCCPRAYASVGTRRRSRSP